MTLFTLFNGDRIIAGPKEWNKKYFEHFKNGKKTPKLKLLKPIYTKSINKTFLINSVNKTFQIKYIFEIQKINKYVEFNNDT